MMESWNRENNELSEIGAEYLLNYFYPEKTDTWQANCKGAFMRNYRPDLIEIDEYDQMVKLSRDGFMKLLPSGLFGGEDELAKKDFGGAYLKMKRRELLLKDLFGPVDTQLFRSRLHLEKAVGELLDNKLNLLLKNFFGYDLEAETEPYIKKLAPMLLHVNRLRGHYTFIKSMLKCILKCEVKMKLGHYAWDETPEQVQSNVTYTVLKPGLDAKAYDEEMEHLNRLNEFINEWFIPFDFRCVIRLKERGVKFDTENGLILNYNTKLA